MASDFDKDEIKDASFPIDFKDDSVSLDMFGVWVKTGPRDATVASPTENISLDSVTLTEDTFVDISDLPDLPDFDNTPEAAESEPENVLSAADSVSFPDITFEEIVTETAEIRQEPIVESTIAEESTDTSSFEDISDIDLDSFLGSSIEVVDSDIEHVSETAIEESVLDEDRSISADAAITDFDEISAVPFSETIIQSESDTISFADQPEPVSAPQIDEISLDDFDASISSGSEYTLSEEFSESSKLTAEVGDIAEIEPSETPQVSEDDFSSFLDDLNADSGLDAAPRSTAPATDDFDLDDFINTVNESGSSSKEDAEKVFSDAAPVDIDLEFDESFIEDVQKIRATGSAVSESEFFNSEFGVELIDESSGTASGAGAESFDDMFASVPDMGDTVSDARIATTQPQPSSVGFEETSEFDELLSSLDLAPAPAAVAVNTDQKVAVTQKKRGYDLVVSDEGNDTISATVSESSVDDDIVVSLDGNEIPVAKATVKEEVHHAEAKDEKIPDLSIDEELSDFFVKDTIATESSVADTSRAEEENLDIPNIRDYNDMNSDTAMDIPASISMEDNVTLEFDDISAVEKDLNDFVPDAGEAQVVTNDKSTELLMIIADELSSIKKEISTLKTEIAGFKSQTEDLVDNAPEHENSGFFTDDDTDETIALTGDELNNILITADFTEEKNTEGEDLQSSMSDIEAPSTAAEKPEIDAVAPDFSASDILSEPAGFDESIVADSVSDEISLNSSVLPGVSDEIEEPEIPDTLPDSILDVPVMDIPLSVEVSHVTTIDDDTSYLEGSDVSAPDLDNVAIEEPELEIIDFEDEKLEEPELTEFNIDLSDIAAEMPAEQEVAVPQESAFEAPVAEVSIDDGLPLADSIPEITEAVQENSVPESGIQENTGVATLPVELKDEIKSVLSYMDQLLESLPEDKIEEFARSEHFEVYKKLFEELGIS